MQNKKIKNIIFLCIVALLLIFIFSSFSNKNSEVLIDNTSSQEENLENKTVEEPKDLLISNTQTVESVSLDISKKYNLAITNAQKASLESNYGLAIEYYNEALNYKKSDTAYSGLYTIYLSQKNWVKALESINNAIKINPTIGDYWKWKILVMKDGLNSSFAELKSVYDIGYPQIKSEEKINLVTNFARISEDENENSYAISLWRKAIELNPAKKDIYQSEIDRISKKQKIPD